jgi:hypothetical protein
MCTRGSANTWEYPIWWFNYSIGKFISVVEHVEHVEYQSQEAEEGYQFSHYLEDPREWNSTIHSMQENYLHKKNGKCWEQAFNKFSNSLLSGFYLLLSISLL